MSPFDVAAPGTPEEVWSAWFAQHPLRSLDTEEIRRLVVVAPHPDDETLGAGGLIHSCRQVGREVVVVAVTDGEAADPGADDKARRTLARRRQAEQREAVRRLGIEDAHLHRLSFGDGQLEGSIEALASRLTPVLDERTTVAVTLSGDGHPDHAATAEAARQAAAVAGCDCIEYPIWAWHWTEPNTTDLPWARGRVHVLSDLALGAKRRAIEAYRSQTDDLVGDAPILPPHVLRRLLRPAEVFFTSAVTA